MGIKFIKGNIFNSKTQTIVNTINCVGVMGKGIALVFKLRYPKMFDLYKDHCKSKQIGIGKLWLYKGEENAPWVLNFPTKFHWKYPSRIEWIESGLQKFIETFERKGIESIAFPLLGTHNGGLDSEIVKNLMFRYLQDCSIDVEIYDYDPSSPDDLFNLFKSRWQELSFDFIKRETGIQPQYARKITEILNLEDISSMISLANYKGIGEKTLEKAFSYVLNSNQKKIKNHNTS